MIDLGKAHQAQCQAALDAFRKSLNTTFELATVALEEAQQGCLKAIAEADEQFSIAAEARVSGAGLAIANTVRQFVGETPIDAGVLHLHDGREIREAELRETEIVTRGMRNADLRIDKAAE
jgi:hypothetical protein